MPASPEQITALLSKYEAVIKRQAAEKKELEKTIDLFESNSRIQAKLLADTGRERDEIRSRLETANNVIGWVESWVCNPVGNYSSGALDGLFGMTRDKIAALTRK